MAPSTSLAAVWTLSLAWAAAAVAAGQPIPGTKPFVTPGSSRGTSVAGMAADKVLGKHGYRFAYRQSLAGQAQGGRLPSRELNLPLVLQAGLFPSLAGHCWHMMQLASQSAQ